MENKYFAELARRLKEDGISTGERASGQLTVLLHGQTAMTVTRDGTVLLMPSVSGDQEADDLYHQVNGLASQVREYTTAMEQAPVLRAQALDPACGFRLLADFNGTVLAGQAWDQGYQFVTWNWTHDRTGVCNGHYYPNDYVGAKAGFAVRSGLIPKERLFTDQQFAEIYRCIHAELNTAPQLTPEREKLLQAAAEQIEYGVPDLEALAYRSNQQEPELNL